MLQPEVYGPEVEAGYVNLIRHPESERLLLLNYTPMATYDLRWNEVTLRCRGLILDEVTGEVVARPFPKFFNEGEIEQEIPAGVPEITIKQDGSLGILYRLDGQVRWATRGSFTSPQSQVCQQIWNEKYADVEVPEELTLLVEIIHPDTRVVVKYDYSDLVLIGAIDRHTGYDYPYEELAALAERLGMRVTERVAGDLLAMRERAQTLDWNEEGFVLRWPNGFRLKVKGKEYLEVHKAVYGLSDNQKLQYWLEGKIEELIRKVPEEFRGEIESLARLCDEKQQAVTAQVEQYVRQAPKESRKEFAIWVNEKVPPALRPLVFRQQDGKLSLAEVRGLVVKLVKESLANA